MSTFKDAKLAQPRLAIMLLFAFFAFFLIIAPILGELVTKICELTVIAGTYLVQPETRRSKQDKAGGHFQGEFTKP